MQSRVSARGLVLHFPPRARGAHYGQYNATPGNIRKTIREYRLLQLAEGLKGLTASEQQRLNDPDLKTNPYTRFFDLSNGKEYLGLSFSGNGDITIQPPRREFDAKLKWVHPLPSDCGISLHDLQNPSEFRQDTAPLKTRLTAFPSYRPHSMPPWRSVRTDPVNLRPTMP